MIRRSHRQERSRRGSAYLLMLTISLVVLAIGLSSMAVERLRTQAGLREADWVQAQHLAHSAVEHGLRGIRAQSEVDANWRQTLKDASNGESPIIAMAGGTMQWKLQDHKGSSLSTDPVKTTYVIGIGQKGRAKQTISVVVRPSGLAFNSLASGIHCQDDMVLASGTVIQCDTSITSNGNIDLTGASVYADVEAAGQIQGFPVVGDTTPSVSPRGMPGGEAFEYYLANGTLIEAEFHLPLSLETYTLENVVLGPGSNPFGPTNPEGIYIIDASGKHLLIQNIRVVGTLVLELPDSKTVTLAGSVNITPAIESLPALVTKGAHLTLALTNAPLDEQVTGVNFNPVGVPYQGEEDAIADDSYPSILRGLVYVKKDVILAGSYNRIEGAVIVGSDIFADPGSLLEVTYRPSIAQVPAPGFFIPDGSAQVGASTWQQVVE